MGTHLLYVDLSFNTGVFPRRLKNAVVVPIHKRGVFTELCRPYTSAVNFTNF